MRLTASDIYLLHRPDKCGLRAYLRNQGTQEAAPSPYDEVLERLGHRHEITHLATFPDALDLSDGNLNERAIRTQEAISKGTHVIYQGVLIADTTVGGTNCEIVGIPDFLIADGSGGYIIRDGKWEV